jgi:nicotinic acid mononucleotide adenylyltransferase
MHEMPAPNNEGTVKMIKTLLAARAKQKQDRLFLYGKDSIRSFVRQAAIRHNLVGGNTLCSTQIRSISITEKARNEGLEVAQKFAKHSSKNLTDKFYNKPRPMVLGDTYTSPATKK